MAEDIARLKYHLGYTFQNISLLKEALTHRSYAVENSLSYDNQRLEFLGDAVLEIAITDYLFRVYPTADEGVLTKMRSALAQQDALAMMARNLELGHFLQTGRGELSANGIERESTLADLFEAVLGALYLDGGLGFAAKFAIQQMEKVYPEPHRLLTSLNPKGALQEYTQKVFSAPPVYTVLSTTGPEHDPVYEVAVEIHNYRAIGHGGSRRHAECNAAHQAIELIARKDAEILNFGLGGGSMPEKLGTWEGLKL